MKWLSGVNATATSWFGSNVPANVNLNQTCNAFWNGTSLNFFKSGSGCSNTGEISDVMQHEWGHGLDQNTKSGSVGDSAKGEAVADGVALLLSHDSCIGPNFLQGGGGETTYCSTGVRDLAYSVTAANISLVCPVSNSCSGALGYECHCESHILSGAYWKLSQSFVLKYGTDEGWARFERLYLRALPNTTAYLAGTAGNAYSAMLVANDDNGNVTDGTPDADLIFNAFNVQGLASGPQSPVNAVACPVSPSAPVVTATAGAGSISLSWNPVNGASSYAIVRRLSLPLGSPAYLPLASNVTGTSYVDTDAAPGFTYTYQVVARVGGCDSPYDTGATATAGPGAADDFSLWLDRNNVAIGPGTSTTVIVHTVVTTGAAQTIALSVSGLPAGVTGSFSPVSVAAGADSALTLTAAVNALPTSTTMTVTGTAVSGTHAAAATVTVSGNDFSMGLAPAAVTVAAGTSKILTVSTTLTSGVAESITMGVSGLPAGVTGTFSPASVPSGNSSTLTLTAASTAAAAAAAFTVSGVAASASHSVKGAITVTAAPGDFSIAVTPTSLSLSPGESETVTVSTATVSGTPQSVTLSVSGLPSGVTGSFSPATVTSGGTATLTLTAGSNASKGTYSVSIVGAAASGSRAATLKLKVSPKKK